MPTSSGIVFVSNGDSSDLSSRSSIPHSVSPPAMFRLTPFLFVFLLAFRGSECHEGHESGGSCEGNPDVTISAEYRPGVMTLDGHADEWGDVEGFELDLRPALDWDLDKAYPGGGMTVKSLHDGNRVYFLLQVDGEYAYAKNMSKKCPSVALMFQIGENASYHNSKESCLHVVDGFPTASVQTLDNMGDCKNMPGSCDAKNCRGHEVDLMHFSIGTAIPGRLYGSNPIDNNLGLGSDRFGHLVDLYAWNPHCRYIDGNDSSAQNDWQGSWWHSTLSPHSGFIEEDSPYSTAGQKGTYYFEFSRPLRTSDRLQQDVQFVIGQSTKFSVAFWYPMDGNPWYGSGHYSVSCDWLTMEILSASASPHALGSSKDSWDATTAFALVISVLSLSLTVFIGYYVSKSKSVPFTPIDRL